MGRGRIANDGRAGEAWSSGEKLLSEEIFELLHHISLGIGRKGLHNFNKITSSNGRAY